MIVYKYILALCFSIMISFPSIAENRLDLETKADVNNTVLAEVENQTGQSRENLISDAVEALDHTRLALKALDEDRVDDALNSLAVSIGKLELVVARHPELALAPTGVSIETHDIYGSKGAVVEAIRQAEELLDDGNVQAARKILSALGSEVIISTANLPLATYPEAIKSISPLIDDGKIAEAKAKLQATLNTIVVTNEVVPLPIVRAQAMLTIATSLADQTEITDEQNETLRKALAATREQIEMAEMLGYGDRDVFKPIYQQLKKIERSADNATAYAELRHLLGGFWQS